MTITINLPTGKMNPHHPMLKGNPPDVAIMTIATINQTIENPHRRRPTNTPKI
jgi:hypothetical protein